MAIDYGHLVRLIDEAIGAQTQDDRSGFSRAVERVVEAIHSYVPTSPCLARAQEYLSMADIPLPRGTAEDSPESELAIVEKLRYVRSLLTDPAMRR